MENLKEQLKAIWEVFVNTLTKEYICFKGRVDRKTFWYFMAIPIVISLILSSIDNKVINIIYALIMLALLLPTLGMWVRRLADINKNWPNIFWFLLPLIGEILLIIWACKEGDKGDNQFGPDPLAKAAAPVAEAPKAEAPKAEEPKPAAPKAPKAKAPKAEAPEA